MDTTYNVIYSGKLQNNADLEDAVRKFAAMTKSPEEKTRALLSAGKPLMIKKGLTREQAQTYHAKLTAIGLEIKIKEVALQTPQKPSSEQEQKPDVRLKTEPPQTQAATPTPPPPPQDTSANPYAAPAASLHQKVDNVAEFLSEPRKVGAGHGWGWIMSGFRLFMEEPMKWLGMFIVFLLLLGPVSLIPVIGNLLNPIIGIVFGGGIMIGAHSLKENEGLRFGHLFSGFTQNRNQLMMLGVYYLLGLIIISIIALLPLGGSMLPLVFGYGAGDPNVMEAAFSQNWPFFIIGVLIAFGLSIPLLMALWLAPSLVAVTGENGFAALKLSLKASLRNIIPQLVYGLGFMAVGILFAIGMGVLSGIMALFAGDGGSIIFAFLPIVLMVFLGAPAMVIMSLSVYAAFRDLFCTAE